MNCQVILGDALEQLRLLPDETAQCCMTSPPYWFLRDYQVDGQIGLEATPEAWVERLVSVFDEVSRVLRDDGVLLINVGDSYAGSGRGGNATAETSGLQGGQESQQASMVKRGAQGATGQRADRMYTSQISASKPAVSSKSTLRGNGHIGGGPKLRGSTLPACASLGLREKNLIGQPWRLAFALQARGWYWRDVIVWAKRNPMPSSVRDRCTPAWEPVLMFSKSARYYWDAEAIRERCSQNTRARLPGNKSHKGATAYANGDEFQRTKGGLVEYAQRKRAAAGSGIKNNDSMDAVLTVMPEYRNKRNVWEISSEPTRDEHFAAYPTALVRPCVLAASRPGDTVLDPFSGTGTTGLVAIELGRSYIGIELSERYVEMQRRRLRGVTTGLPLEVAA